MSPIEAAAREFLSASAVNGCSPKTVDWYSEHLHRFVSHAVTGFGNDWATRSAVRSFFASLPATLSPHSVDAYYRTMRRFFNFCAEEGLVTGESPMTAVKRRRPVDNRPKAASSDTIRQLIAASRSSDPVVYAAVMILADTGARAAEVCGLRFGDIANGSAVITGKGNKQRRVFISAQTLEAVLALYAGDDDAHVIPGRGKNGRMRPRSLHQLIVKFARNNGISGRCNPHAFRHWHAMESVRSGMDVISVGRLLGHSDVTVTQRYVRWSDDDLALAHRSAALISSVSGGGPT